MTTETKIHAREDGHWYTKDGQPAYTVTAKNGNERQTTLRDARKLGLVPSVTTIMREASKFALERWKQEQILLAALTLPRVDSETEQEYVDRIINDSQEQGKQAAERGSLIHAYVQSGFEGLPLNNEGYEYFEVSYRELEKNGLRSYSWDCEKPFAIERYGGKVDLSNPNGIVIDIKTKEELTDKTCTIYDEHAMQLAAYSYGLDLPRATCGILFVATKSIEARLVWIEEEKLIRGWNMFNALLDYWYAKTGLS